MNISNLTDIELLQLNSELLDELKSRKIIRTRNNPVADYAEWLVSKKMGLALQTNSKAGFDAIDNSGIRYQIKSRRLDPTNNSTQLGVIRNYEKKEFDYLIGVLFNKDFTVKGAYKIPHNVIGIYSKYSTHQNGHILHLKNGVLNDKDITDITKILLL